MKRLITYGLAAFTFLSIANAQDTIAKTSPDTVAATNQTDSAATAAPANVGVSTQPHTTTFNTATSSNTTGATLQNNFSGSKYPSPYKVTFKTDAPIIVAGIGLTFLGTRLIANKDSLTNAQLATKTKDKLPFFDRGNAGYYSLKADENSYIPFKLSFGLPVVLALLNKHERQNIGTVYTMYLETMAVTGTLFTMATGTVYRSRPYVYKPFQGPDYPDDARRRENDSQRAFFAGHTAATAAATFFTAQVFSDFNPDSKLKPLIWVVAAATPALVGYWRYKAGMHFLSDNLLGYGLGAAAGILIPKWHRVKGSDKLSIVPEAGKDYKGMSLTYKF
jgi:membrane-associated phospholipid phosphatase